MNRRYRFLGLFVPITILCSLVLIAPLNATQRMVLVEEYTNSG